ncbi:MAG: hypothetical protein ACI82G_001194, partial [Bradymonadia bacterium]
MAVRDALRQRLNLIRSFSPSDVTVRDEEIAATDVGLKQADIDAIWKAAVML